MHVSTGQFEQSLPPAESSAPNGVAERFAWPFVIACALLAFSVLIYSTRKGAGLTIDSQRYLEIARGFPGTLGVAKPSDNTPGRDVRYPPMLPMVLGLAKAFGGDPWTWARWFNGLLVIVNLVLVALLLFQLNSRRSWPELWCIAMLATSSDLISLHAFIWSEPLYLSFMLMMLIAILKYLRDPNRAGMLVLAAVFAGLGCLTRYAGISLILGGTLAVVLLSNAPSRKRWIHAISFGAIASACLGTWVVGNLIASGSATGRPFSYRPVPLEQFNLLVYTMVNWWAPLQLPKFLRVDLALLASLTILCVLAMLIRPLSRRPHQDQLLLFQVLGIFGITYILFLVVSRTFFDHATPLDYRILSPLFVSAIIMCTLIIKWILERSPRPIVLSVVIGLFCVAMLPAYQTNTAIWAYRVSKEGLGYARARFTDPKLMEALERIEPDEQLYANDDRGLEMRVGWDVQLIPDPGKTDRKQAAKTRQFRKDLAARRTWLLFFTRKRKGTEYLATEIDGTLAKLTEEAHGAQWTLYSTEPLPRPSKQP